MAALCLVISSASLLPQRHSFAFVVPLAAGIMARLETLKNMNGSSAKHATWVVRVCSSSIIPYSFFAKGVKVNAEKFEAILVSQNPKEFMIGSVPFSFKDRQGAAKAHKKFTPGSVWEIKTPHFDTKQKPEYISCPQKTVVVLEKPTTIRPIAATEAELYAHPANHVDVGMNITELVKTLKEMKFVKRAARPASGSQASSNNNGTRLLNVCGKMVAFTDQKATENKEGTARMVAQMELVDDSGASVDVSVWDDAFKLIKDIPCGEGLTIIGVTAVKNWDADTSKYNIKLNIWEGAQVLRGGDRAKSLTGMDLDPASSQKLTAVFVPTMAPVDVNGPAVMTCCKALAQAPGRDGDTPFQLNRVLVNAPTSEDAIVTQDKERLWIPKAVMRDWTGPVEVDILDVAAPCIYGLQNREEVKQHLEKGTLATQCNRVNIRGVIRRENGIVKRLVAEVTKSPFDAQISARAMRATLGLAEVEGDVVQAAPAERLLEHPMLGLAVKTQQDEPISAYRVLLLVQGTCESTLDVHGSADGQSLEAQSFLVTSEKVRCLLSTSETYVDLRGYCDFKSMLTYRLDRDCALVLASAISNDGERSMLTVEHMSKIGTDRDIMVKSLTAECTAALGDPLAGENITLAAPDSQEYWEEPPRKVRRIVSELASPPRPKV